MTTDSDTKSGSTTKSERATIGESISIKGEVTGSEDLLVLGAVEGTINLKDNTVTVGKGARVNADIIGNIIHVEGDVTGNLQGKEQVIVHKTGQVRGNIASPRLSLQDGARLKGAIDTEVPTEPTEVTIYETDLKISKKNEGLLTGLSTPDRDPVAN